MSNYDFFFFLILYKCINMNILLPLDVLIKFTICLQTDKNIKVKYKFTMCFTLKV